MLEEYKVKTEEFVIAHPNDPISSQFSAFLSQSLDTSARLRLLFMYLYARVGMFSNSAIIDNAIFVGLDILELTSYPDGATRSDISIGRLAKAEKAVLWYKMSQLYQIRFDKLRRIEDLDQCIVICQKSMELHSDGGIQEAM